jgi:hypothetical protein
MNTLTIRGIEDHALDQLRKQAKSKHSSVNKFVVDTLQKVAFPGEPGKVRDWHDLDAFLGSWSKEESDQIIERCGRCRKIDPELWR